MLGVKNRAAAEDKTTNWFLAMCLMKEGESGKIIAQRGQACQREARDEAGQYRASDETRKIQLLTDACFREVTSIMAKMQSHPAPANLATVMCDPVVKQALKELH